MEEGECSLCLMRYRHCTDSRVEVAFLLQRQTSYYASVDAFSRVDRAVLTQSISSFKNASLGCPVPSSSKALEAVGESEEPQSY